MTAATWIIMVVLVGYAVAIIPPTYRIFKYTGGKIGELLPILAIGGASCGYVAAGSAAPMPAIMISMFAGDLVCRMIRKRHQGDDHEGIEPPRRHRNRHEKQETHQNRPREQELDALPLRRLRFPDRFRPGLLVEALGRSDLGGSAQAVAIQEQAQGHDKAQNPRQYEGHSPVPKCRQSESPE